MWGQPPNPFALQPMDPAIGIPPLRMPPPPSPMAAAVQAKPQSHAFFREGGPGRTIIGIIADALAGAAGGQGTYAPLMLQKYRMKQEADQRALEDARKANEPVRTQVGEDLVQYDPATKQTSVLYHGQAKADELTRLLDSAGISDPAERQRYYRQKADAFVAPPMVSAPGYDEQGNPVVRLFPRTGSSTGEPPPGAVAYLKAHPDQARSFEEKYGASAASRYLGGPAPQAPGTFR